MADKTPSLSSQAVGHEDDGHDDWQRDGATPAASPDSALGRELNAALQAVHSGDWQIFAPARDGRYLRAELVLDALDPLDWISGIAAEGGALPSGGLYWSNRRQSRVVAGAGCAAVIGGDQPTSFAAVCAHARALLGSHRQRCYGGFAFGSQSQRQTPPRDADDRLWAPFGTYRFVLPRIELGAYGSRTVLACHLHDDDRAGIEEAAQLTRGGESLQRRSVTAATPETIAGTLPRLAASWPPRHVPDIAGWRAVIGAALDRFGQPLDGADLPLEKIVLGRRTACRLDGRPSAWHMLQRLRLVNPHAFHFAVQPSPETTFFGASPERLASLAGGTVETEALAGTRPRGAGAAEDQRLEQELLASEKELREHRYVHQSIAESLDALCTKVATEQQVRVRKQAHVQHLYSSFTGTLRNGTGIEHVLDALHPTPAVGGSPKPGVVELIQSMEHFDRGWYAGPVGWLSADAAEFAVAIRCGMTHDDALYLYAGNGIVRGSSADAEWAEMEQKIRQMLEVV